MVKWSINLPYFTILFHVLLWNGCRMGYVILLSTFSWMTLTASQVVHTPVPEIMDKRNIEKKKRGKKYFLPGEKKYFSVGLALKADRLLTCKNNSLVKQTQNFTQTVSGITGFRFAHDLALHPKK